MSTDGERTQNLDAIESALRTTNASSAKVELSGVYDLPKISPKMGERYFGFRCEPCRIISPAFPDPSNGKLARPFVGTGSFKIQCCFSSKAHPHELEGGVDDIISIPWP
jgi:hypothetical protein